MEEWNQILQFMFERPQFEDVQINFMQCNFTLKCLIAWMLLIGKLNGFPSIKYMYFGKNADTKS